MQKSIKNQDDYFYKNEVIKMSTGDTYKVQSSVDPDVYYIVKIGFPRFCSCPDFCNRGAAKNPDHVCKHMRIVLAAKNNGTVIISGDEDYV